MPSINVNIIEEALARFPALGPFRVEPRHTHARNGSFSYSVIAFAERAGTVLFLSLETLQFGLGVTTGEGLVNGTQFPAVGLAALTFLQLKDKAVTREALLVPANHAMEETGRLKG